MQYVLSKRAYVIKLKFCYITRFLLDNARLKQEPLLHLVYAVILSGRFWPWTRFVILCLRLRSRMQTAKGSKDAQGGKGTHHGEEEGHRDKIPSHWFWGQQDAVPIHKLADHLAWEEMILQQSLSASVTILEGQQFRSRRRIYIA